MDSGWVRQNSSKGSYETSSGSLASSWGHVTPLPFVGSNEELLEALHNGHPGAANAFYDRYADVVDRILSRVIGPDGDLPDMIPDLIEEAFLRAVAGAGRLRDPARLPAFVAAAAVGVARRFLRRRARARWWARARQLAGPRKLAPRSDSSLAGPLAGPQEVRAPALRAAPIAGPIDGVARAMHALYVTLDELPVEERIVLALRVVDAMSPAEIAEMTGASLRRMRRRSRRAEARFVAVARKSAVLGPWLDRGARWSLPTLG